MRWPAMSGFLASTDDAYTTGQVLHCPPHQQSLLASGSKPTTGVPSAPGERARGAAARLLRDSGDEPAGRSGRVT